MKRNRGAVLIVVLGVLMLLSLLAATFAQVSILDRRVSRNYLDGVRAELIARSGVEAATADIMAAAQRGLLNDPALVYWGSNATESGTPDVATKLELAKNPSFAWEDQPTQNPSDAIVAPLMVNIDGTDVGFSGLMATGTYAPNADIFRLRVADANSMIHVNDGLAGGPTGSVSLNLKRILNTLGSLVGVPAAGDKILAARPAAGFRTKRELEGCLGASGYAKIAPHVTAGAWVDPDVVNPVPLSSVTLGAYPVQYNASIGMFRYGRSKDSSGVQITNQPLKFAPEYASPTGTDHAVMALDELNAQWIERTSRAPVNVNRASKQVLTALIAGLRGWFLIERRKTNPAQGMYTYLCAKKYDNTPTGVRGDEVGYLYSTPEFLGPSTSPTAGVAASAVADEIIACRTKGPSPNCPGLDYSAVWWGGPFRTWRQFYAFCDGLVIGGLIKDTRTIYYDFQLTAPGSHTTAPPANADNLVPSTIQPKFAAQAMADVLKANFNPNCTPNELNPDANLYLIVDKTDLLCNSTEFCFTPMGTFEIESEGIVLQTADHADFLQAKKGTIVARRKVACVLEAFRPYRETTQAAFYKGTFGPRASSTTITSNNRTTESGPEPDNGPAPAECQWAGWIQLATVGGPWHTSADGHVPGALEATPQGSAEKGDVMHGHFQFDHRLHHHAAGDFAPMFAGTTACKNWADRTESGPGPYGPTTGSTGQYRLARQWGIQAPPVSPAYTAPGDLRIDGAFVERDSAVLYKNGASVMDALGTVSYWIKPSFRPEMTGKPRTLFSMDTKKTIGSKDWQIINGQWFFASQDVPAFSASPNESILPVYPMGPWRPCSFVGGYSTWGSVGGGVGTETAALNHRAHSDTSSADLLRHHGWTHVTYHWNFTTKKAILWINGALQPGAAYINVHPGNATAADFYTDGTPLRLGEPSRTMTANSFVGTPVTVSRNWSADSTIDEFFMWKGNQLTKGQDLFALGRYYRPRKDLEALFTSQELKLTEEPRVMPPPSAAVPTGSPSMVPPPTMSMPVPQARILAATWTWMPESVTTSGSTVTRDYFTELDTNVEVELSFVVNGTETADVFKDDGGAAVSNLTVSATDTLRYRIRMRTPDATASTILLATPVLDDVTIFYTSGVRYLSYEAQGVTP